MLVESLREQWICSCGNWVDLALNWCPDCCDEKLKVLDSDQKSKKK